MTVIFPENLPATLIWTHEGAPRVIPGRLGRTEGDELELKLEGPDRPAPDERCILLLEGPEKHRVMAQVTGVSEGGVRLRPGKQQALRRYYPRVDTPASFVFRVLDPGKAAAGLSKRQLAVMKSWARPVAQEMNLSVDGMAFLSVLAIPAGARLQVKLSLPNAPQVDHSVVGDVVRSSLETLADGEEYHRVAVHLTVVPPETHQALLDYIRYWQDEALEQLELPR